VGTGNVKQDAKIGDIGEFILPILLQRFKDLTIISRLQNSDGDVILSDGFNDVLYEIKTDLYKKTGNICIEYECRNKPSGLYITKAKWFCIYLLNLHEMWIIECLKLKEIIEKDKCNFKKINAKNKQNNNTLCYLLPRYKYKNYFYIYRITDDIIKQLPNDLYSVYLKELMES
jgi:hypothetical protein